MLGEQVVLGGEVVMVVGVKVPASAAAVAAADAAAVLLLAGGGAGSDVAASALSLQLLPHFHVGFLLGSVHWEREADP